MRKPEAGRYIHGMRDVERPIGLMKRGLTKKEAAEYCGCCSIAAFDRWQQKGIVPPAIPGTNRWDRKALDQALDRASGLVTESNQELTPYQSWKARNARKAEAAQAQGHSPR